MMKIWRVWLIFFFIILFFGSNAEARRIVFAWDPNTDLIAGYRLYWSTNRSAVVNRQVSPITLGANQYCYCLDIDESTTNLIFVAVSAYGTPNNESGLSNIVYWLAGNIAGDDNDGTPYTSARVDGGDLTAMGALSVQYFGSAVSHPTHNCNDCATIHASPLPTLLQKCDYNMDGRFDGFDLIEAIGLHFGNAAY